MLQFQSGGGSLGGKEENDDKWGIMREIPTLQTGDPSSAPARRSKRKPFEDRGARGHPIQIIIGMKVRISITFSPLFVMVCMIFECYFSFPKFDCIETMFLNCP